MTKKTNIINKMANDIQDGIIIYSTEGNIMFTSTGEIDNNKKTPRKHKINKSITNPVFEKMKDFTENKFWITFLGKCSRNIFPKDFKYVNDILVYKMKTKKHRAEIYIDEKRIEDSFKNLKHFLRLRGIFPKEDLEENEIINLEKREPITKWKDLGKNRLNVLHDYVNQLKIKYDLTSTERRYLESLLKISINSDIFNNDNIILEDEAIKSIDYLVWKEKERKFIVDINNIPLKFPKVERKKAENFYSVSTFSNDLKHNFNQNLESFDMGKKWNKFLISMYTKK